MFETLRAPREDRTGGEVSGRPHPIEQIAQDAAEQPQAHARRLHVADRPLQFEVIPNVCLIPDVCHFLRISERRFHYLDARKELALVEMKRVDRVRRFTGASVALQIKLWTVERSA